MFEYVMVLASVIIGLGVAHLLQGVAEMVQHPKRAKPYWIHLVWVAYAFFLIIFWWWWEFQLRGTKDWTFQFYFFILFYAFLMYLMCALLFPREFEEGQGFREYFYNRRGWFFGVQAAYILIDMLDSWLKGPAHFASLGPEYMIANLIQVPAFIAGAIVRSPRFHAVLAVATLIYQVSWGLRYFDTIN